MDVKVIKRSRGKEIDLLCKNVEIEALKLQRKGFFLSEYLGQQSGIFLKKLTTKGLRTLHLQEEIFYIKPDNTMIIIKGFSQLILTSKYNYDYMIYMMKIFYEKQIKERYCLEIEKVYQKPYEKIDIEKEIFIFIKAYGLKQEIRSLRKERFIKKLKRMKMFLFPRYIAITGMDGSGKSTIVELLHQLMGHNSQVIYMGKKEWQTSIAAYAFKEKRFPSILNLLILYGEFWYRWLQSFKSTKVIIFDRYPSEMYLSQIGIRRKVYALLFNRFFPSPSQTFYLYCSPSDAYARKSDIVDKALYIRMKEMFDEHYASSNTIDTSKKDVTQTLKEIITKLNPKIMEML